MKGLKWIVLLFGIVGLAVSIGAPVGAQSKSPCADEITKFCKEVKPGGGRLARCLKEHEKDLSSQCKASIDEARARAKGAHEKCADDIQKFCSDVKPGRGGIVRCLKENERQLSPERREQLTRGGKKAQ